MRRLPWTIMLATAFAASAGATPPAPSYGSATVDGLYAEWNLASDFFADMYRSGNPDHPLESKAYLRYDCLTRTMYVLVLDEPGVTGYHDPNHVTSWVAIDRQNNKVVNEDAGVDGIPPDFAWVGEGYDGNPLHNQGFEASFTIQPGTYHIIIHTNVLDGGTQTSATTGFPNTGPLLIIDCSIGACCAPDGSCAVTIQPDCSAPDVWHGEWTACSPNPCPQPLGACCAPDGSCAVTFQASCTYEWLGAGSTCTPNPCPQPLGACCHPDGTCTVSTEADCPPPAAWLGMGTVCEPNPCPQPLGACCNTATGECAMTTEAGCVAPGNWLGPEFDCEPVNPCSPVPNRKTSWGQIKARYR